MWSGPAGSDAADAPRPSGPPRVPASGPIGPMLHGAGTSSSAEANAKHACYPAEVHDGLDHDL
jgi:hypothetical protein